MTTTTVTLKLTSTRMIEVPIARNEELRADATRVRLSLTHHDLAVMNLVPSDDVRLTFTDAGAIASIDLDVAEAIAETTELALHDGDVRGTDADRARHVLAVMRVEIAHALRCRNFLAA